ncbi:MAG: DUF4123 domain-containing protein [Duganella sp.]
MKPYLLIDTTLLGDLDGKPWLKRNRQPVWIAPLYGRDAIEVSPVVVDVESAINNDRIAAMMALVNARTPQVGVSFIETTLSLREIVQHLQKFTFILTPDGEELTLRFADCLVLPALAITATPAQWSALVGPFSSWKVHGRDGWLLALPMQSTDVADAPPLVFSGTQLAELKEAMGIDQLLFNLKNTMPSRSSFLATPKAYELASSARQIWREAGHSDGVELLRFLHLVFETDGNILTAPLLRNFLAQKNYALLHEDLTRLL